MVVGFVCQQYVYVVVLFDVGQGGKDGGVFVWCDWVDVVYVVVIC